MHGPPQPQIFLGGTVPPRSPLVLESVASPTPAPNFYLITPAGILALDISLRSASIPPILVSSRVFQMIPVSIQSIGIHFFHLIWLGGKPSGLAKGSGVTPIGQFWSMNRLPF